jgi:ATP-dependent metalloprotease FtsH
MEIMQITKNKKFKPILIAGSLIIVSLIVWYFLKFASTTLISGKEFEKLTQNSNIEQIYIKDRYIFLKNDKGNFKTPLSAIDSKKILKNYPVEVYSKSSNTLVVVAVFLLLSILVTLLFILRKNSEQKEFALNLDNNSDEFNTKIEPTFNSDISFKDIAGISEIKDDILEIVEFLKNPIKYKALGVKLPKGVLLVGPPGVGKTLLAKAISSEAGVPFFYHSGASFVQIYAGMGPKKVKELFSAAKENSPSIIFIDEIDAVGKSREAFSNDEREATLNQLLIEMDGFEDSNVVVIGATNRVDILDSALLRPGRFDRRLFIDLPNVKEREQILKLYLNGKNFDFNISEVAKITTGFSPAALSSLINEAQIYVLKNKKSKITLQDIYAVKDRVVFGKKKVPILSDKEKEIQALYNATKAAVAVWLGFGFDKVTLINSFYFSKEESIVSKKTLLNRVYVLISGSLSLKNRYKDIYSIAIEDKKEALNLLEQINRDYEILDNKTITLEEINKNVNDLIVRLNDVINKLSKRLLENEALKYSEVKKSLDEVF